LNPRKSIRPVFLSHNAYIHNTPLGVFTGLLRSDNKDIIGTGGRGNGTKRVSKESTFNEHAWGDPIEEKAAFANCFSK
jgi:hypothetical protein